MTGLKPKPFGLCVRTHMSISQIKLYNSAQQINTSFSFCIDLFIMLCYTIIHNNIVFTILDTKTLTVNLYYLKKCNFTTLRSTFFKPVFE